MEKEFIPYEQALALKELGFDEPCLAFYNGKFLQSTEYDFDEGTSKDIGLCCKTPTFSQAFRWFREKYGLFYDNLNYIGNVWKFSTYSAKEEDYFQSAEYKTYEEAELACLRKLIQIVNSHKLPDLTWKDASEEEIKSKELKSMKGKRL